MNDLAKRDETASEVINPAIAKAAESVSIMQSIAQEVNLMPTIEEFRYRLPRLGKIRIGIKAKRTTQDGREIEYPKAVDYFVLPEVLQNDKDFQQALIDRGIDPDKPKALPIMLLRNGIGEDVISSYDLYGKSKGLVCRSYDFVNCQRVNPKTLEMETVPCTNKNCPDWKSKACKCITRIRFLLPDAIGVGVWQLDTSSKNSHADILIELMTAKTMLKGKLAGANLLMTLEPEIKHIPAVDFKGNVKYDNDGNAMMAAQTIYVVHIRALFSLRNASKEIEQAHEYDGAEAVDMEYEEVETEVIAHDENGEVIESPDNTQTQGTDTSEPIQDSANTGTERVESDPLASKDQKIELQQLMEMKFGADRRACNLWAKGMLGRVFNAKDLTEMEATMLISELETALMPDEADEPLDAEYSLSGE